MLAKVRLPRFSLVALKTPEYRWFWVSRLTLSASMQMEGVVQGWLVYQLTGSSFALGWVGAGWSIAILSLSLQAGVVCDRFDKRTIVMLGRLATALNSAVIALLVATGWIQVWHLALSSLARGIINAFMMPALGATTIELVDRDALLNANAVNAMAMGLAGIFAASLSGWLIDVSGPSSSYLVMAGLNIAGMALLKPVPSMPTRRRETGSLWLDLQDGIVYLKHAPLVVAVQLLNLLRILFVMPYGSLMPAYVQDNLHLEASALGMITSAASVGALISALLLCSATDIKGKGRVVIVAHLATALAMLGLANLPWFVTALGFSALIGFFNNICMILLGTLLGTLAAPEYRGRMMAANMMLWGLTPVGSIPAGALADVTGVPAAISLLGVLVLAAVGWAYWKRPALRTLD